jgi:hypothetical protein
MPPRGLDQLVMFAVTVLHGDDQVVSQTATAGR